MFFVGTLLASALHVPPRHLLVTLLMGCAVGDFDDETVTSKLARDGGRDETTSGFAPTDACPTSLTRCGSDCVDIRNNSRHCGECGKVCIDAVCSAGACMKTESDAGTPESSPCPGVDLKNDPSNCGACGASCPSGWKCMDGKCDVSCVAPQVLCSGLCVDTNSHASHCGGCGKACPASYACVGGTCELNCTGKQQKCGDTCADVSKDKNNCGECGNKCPLLSFCVLGTCLGL
jgi:hypothetical protein